MSSGGRREGAGRKPKPEGRRIQFTITLPEEKLAFLDERAAKMGKTRAEVVEELLDLWKKILQTF